MNTLARLLLLTVLIVSIAAACARAQTRDNSLRAIAQFGLMAEGFEEDSELCGLTRDGVSAALMLSASHANTSPLTVTPLAQNNGSLLYLRIDTVMARPSNPAWPIDACVSTIQLSARVLQDITLTASERTVFATVLLWSTTLVATSPRSGHAKIVGREVEKLTRLFIEDWTLDNRAR